MTYDPAFTNTAACRSRITYIDGDKGILLYRGYPIEQLAEHSNFLETAYLILFGELPTAAQLEAWTQRHHAPHDAAREHQEADARASATTRTRWACSSARSARSSTFYPDAKHILDADVAAPAERAADRQGADASPPTRYRHSTGRRYVHAGQRR